MNKENSNAQLIRQVVLVVILVIVLAGFLYDRYVLFPDATEKINKVMNEISMRLSDENRDQVHEILGRKPTSTFTHNGIEVEQYRFPRGLPFFPRPVLDIAYDGNTLAFFRQEPIDNAYIESQRGTTMIDTSLKEKTGEPMLMGSGGSRTPIKQPDQDEGSDSKEEENNEESSDEGADDSDGN